MIDLLGQRVLKKGLISREDLDKAFERQRLYGGRIGFNLIALNCISESDLNSFFKFTPFEPGNITQTNLELGFVTDLILKHSISLKKFTIAQLTKKVKLP